ncbi:MAG: hypothetical protein HY779_00310, partial [Rubrobacteridae bacterium]|nr:hypothetical protein [Rubrobacteridae bacterium]
MLEAGVAIKQVEKDCFENLLPPSDDDTGELEILFHDYNGDLMKYKSIVTGTDKKLSMLQYLTEEIFLKIGDKLPEINGSLTESENEAKRLLDYFKQESGFLTENTKTQSSDLARLNAASSYLLETVKDQGEAFSQMSDMMARIENIKQSVESVREFSVKMETLSINAAIIAIKAGEEGRSLNPITDELNKMANAAIRLIDEITRSAAILTEKYNSFQELSDRQVTLCKESVENTNSQVASRYKDLQKSIVCLIRWLDDVLISLSSAKDPICKIMNELQVQDIVKQCTDHVRVSLETAKNEDVSNRDADSYYDAVHFQEKVPLLCVELLDDIDTRIANSTEALSVELESIKGISNEVLSSYSSDNKSGKSGDNLLEELERSFDLVRSVALDMAEMMQNMSNSWDDLLNTTTELEGILELINNQFTRLKKITNFHQINIP